MEKTKLIATVIISIITLVGCTTSDNENDPNGNRTELSITAGIATTRSAYSQWKNSDNIGLILFDHATTNIYDGKTNFRYITTEGSSIFNADGEANKAYLPSGGKQADLVAYYPYSDQVSLSNLNIPVNVSSQNNLSAIDLMASEKVNGLSASNNTAAVTFSHKLCKLIFKVLKDSTSSDIDLSGSTVVLKGTKVNATWNLTTSTLTQDGNASDISLPMNADGTEATAIVLPTAAGSGVSFTLTTKDGHSYTTSLNSTFALEAGTNNIFTMTIHRHTAAISTSVLPWITGIETGEATQLDVITGSSITLPTGEKGTFYISTVENANTLTGIYDWNKSSLTASSPIYWEQLSQSSHIFKASFIPSDNAPAGNLEKDYLTATSQSTGFGDLISLQMKHAMAAITVNLSSSNTNNDTISSNLFTSEELKSAIISFVSTMQSKVDYTTGEVSIESSSPAKTVTLPLYDASKATFTGMTAPQTLSSINIMINGKSYTLNKNITLAAGTSNQLTLNITKSSLGMNATITGWSSIELGNTNIDIDK